MLQRLFLWLWQSSHFENDRFLSEWKSVLVTQICYIFNLFVYVILTSRTRCAKRRRGWARLGSTRRRSAWLPPTARADTGWLSRTRQRPIRLREAVTVEIITSWFVLLNFKFQLFNFACKFRVPFSFDCWLKDTCEVSPRLAPTVLLRERSLFMIKVLYFVQVKVSTGRFSRDLLLKVPFILAPNQNN